MVTLKNRRRVQNHIGGLHACGMALAAESATGIVVGMNVPDSAIPLCKSMKINFVRRCEGGWVAGLGGGLMAGPNPRSIETNKFTYVTDSIHTYTVRCVGDIKAVAHLTEEQLAKIHTDEKGDVLVNVEVGCRSLWVG